MCQNAGAAEPPAEPPATRFVAALLGSLLSTPQDPVADALLAAQEEWSGARDSSALRVRLLDLLRLLEAKPAGGEPR